MARGRFSEYKGMWPAQVCHRSFFFKIEEIEKNENEKEPKKQKIHFLYL